MRKATALLLGVLLPLLGLSGIGRAQSSVQVQGTIQSVDCQAQTVVLSGPDTSNTIAVAPYTAVLVNSTSVPFCALQQYVGLPATAWLLASGNEFVATRIDIVGQVAVAPPAPPEVVATPLPIAGIVLGTIIVAGLVYLLVRDHDGRFYRYPYYGSYYHYYYRPEYRPYFGPPPLFAPIITIPPFLAGIVLGTVIVGGLAYLVVHDRDGRFYRYPYYGPYYRYYYRPQYRSYSGPYRDAPVYQGNPRLEPPAYRNAPDPRGSGYRDPGGRGVAPQSAPRGAPTYRNAPAYPRPVVNAPAPQNVGRRDAPGYRDPGGRGVAPQSAPRGAPTYRNAPAYPRPVVNAPAPQNVGRRDAPGYRDPGGRGGGPGYRGRGQRCSDPRSNQCSGGR